MARRARNDLRARATSNHRQHLAQRMSRIATSSQAAEAGSTAGRPAPALQTPLLLRRAGLEAGLSGCFRPCFLSCSIPSPAGRTGPLSGPQWPPVSGLARRRRLLGPSGHGRVRTPARSNGRSSMAVFSRLGGAGIHFCRRNLPSAPVSLRPGDHGIPFAFCGSRKRGIPWFFAALGEGRTRRWSETREK